jgi:peptidoglycan/xylan/chitin deacetylase (PgdA/CDA1 family)
MEKAIITTSWDDGHPLDLKLAELLSKYNIPGTFYVPIERVKRGCMSPDEIREISRSFDVGGHTYHHVKLPQVSPREAESEVVDGKTVLEEIIDRQLSSFCYPYGEYNGRIVSLVKDAGFIGARTMRSLTRRVNDPFRMGSTVYALDWGSARYMWHSMSSQDLGLFYFLLRGNLFLKRWDRIAVETLDFIVRNGGIWHLWGHSWEIDDNGDWRRLESVLGEISSLSEYATLVDNSHLLAIRCQGS